MRVLAFRTITGLAVVCGMVLAQELVASTPDDDPPTIEEVEAAGELYRSACVSCHLPPDPDHATDRAWLNQVTDTA